MKKNIFYIALFGFALRLLCIYFVIGDGIISKLDTTGKATGTDAVEYSALANGLVDGKGYVDNSGKPTARKPVLFPFYLAQALI